MRIVAHHGHRPPALGSVVLSCVVFALSLVGTGCGPSASDRSRPTTVSDEDLQISTSGEPTPTVDAREVKARAVLLAAVDAMVTNCEIDQDLSTVTRCANDEQQVFLKQYADGSRSRAALLGAWAQLLREDDGARVTVGAYVLGGLMRTLSPDGSRPVVTPEIAKALIASLAGLPRFHAARSIVGITHAAALAGQLDALIIAAEQHPHHEALLPIVYSSMLRYTRLAGFPALQLAQAKDTTDPRLVAATMSAPRALVDATPSERATLCEWVRPFCADSRVPVANEAANTMLWCGGKFIDALLDHAVSDVKAGTMDKNLTIPLRRLCPTPPGHMSTGSEAQCARTLQVLEAAVRNTKIDEDARIQALVSVHRLRPDRATLRLAKEARKQAGDQLRFRATTIVEALNQALR